MTQENITIEGNITSLTVKEVINGFKFSNSIADILKWSLLGLYVKNDEEEIKELESYFKQGQSLHDKRAYKTEAKAIYKHLKQGDEIALGDTVFTLANIASVDLENRPFSIGVVYKALPKKEPKNKNSNDLRKIAKIAIESNEIDTGEMKAKQLIDMSNGVMGNEFIDIANNKLDKARELHTLQLAQEKANKAITHIPAYSLEPEAFMETLKAMIAQVQAFEGDLTPITDYIMELQTEPQEQVKAA